MQTSGGDEQISSIVAAAHELKSPLALMRQLSLRLADENLPESRRAQYIRQITLVSERSLRLTSNLTKAARLEDALFSLEPINPDQLCRDIVTELTPLFESYGRTLQLEERRHPLLLIANRDLLRRIILGFSDNALHYAQASTPVRIQIQALKRAGYVRIGVRDYGPALSSSFWQEMRRTSLAPSHVVQARPESSGLGLYISQQFAEAMNGRIGTVRHKDGATFYVELQASSQLSLL